MANTGKKITGADTYHKYTTAQTSATIYTPTTEKAFFLTGYNVSTTAANVVTIAMGATTVLGFDFAANGGANLDAGDNVIAICPAGSVPNVTSSGSTNLYVTLWGYEL